MVAIFFLVWGGHSCPPPLIFLLLPLLRSALRRLQRIDRRRTRESAALSWRLLRLIDHDVTAVRAGNAALNHQQVLFLIHAQDAQVASRDPGIAHVARHSRSEEHTSELQSLRHLVC